MPFFRALTFPLLIVQPDWMQGEDCAIIYDFHHNDMYYHMYAIQIFIHSLSRLK